VKELEVLMVEDGRVVRIFENLVKIYSPSYKERFVAGYIKGYVEALGFLAYEDEAGKALGGDAGNVLVTIPGTADGPCILFAAHMDTVEPSGGIEPVIEDGVIKSKGDTILGADDKAGVAAMLELISVLEGKLLRHGPVHLAFTIAEEVGLEGAKHLDLSDVNVDYAYVLDSNGPVGTVVVGAPYQDSFEVEYTGRAAHAGVAPELGINAIVAASKAICGMNIGRIDEDTTSNVGTIEGGRAGNIVPAKVNLLAEARSIDPAKLEKQAHHMIECFKKGADETGAEVNIKRTRPYDGYLHSENDPVVKKVVDTMTKLGLTPRLIKSGGGSDTNVFNAKGISTVNLGMGAEDVHTDDEYVPVQELANMAQLLVELVKI